MQKKTSAVQTDTFIALHVHQCQIKPICVELICMCGLVQYIYIYSECIKKSHLVIKNDLRRLPEVFFLYRLFKEKNAPALTKDCPSVVNDSYK